MSVLQLSKYPTLLIQKRNKNCIIFNFVLFQVIDFIQYKFDYLKQYFMREKRSKDALNHRELCEIATQT